MGQHDGVVVDVDDPAVRRHALGHLVGVVGGRDAGADVEELPDAQLGGEEADRTAEEGAVGPDREHQVGIGGQGPLAELPVSGEVVFPAQPVVVDPGYMRDASVEVGHQGSLSDGTLEPIAQVMPAGKRLGLHHLQRLRTSTRRPDRTTTLRDMDRGRAAGHLHRPITSPNVFLLPVAAHSCGADMSSADEILAGYDGRQVGQQAFCQDLHDASGALSSRARHRPVHRRRAIRLHGPSSRRPACTSRSGSMTLRRWPRT